MVHKIEGTQMEIPQKLEIKNFNLVWQDWLTYGYGDIFTITKAFSKKYWWNAFLGKI